ncbi:cbb3-type cytochrome oxidase assembly protein CcoS [Granulosicoccaceae sp. 1_MG-2023]|nr:cbb3-type cytochrome oxidase assembly protein CcoS [Granulosicoccaceae sp. 1_MG-2023]
MEVLYLLLPISGLFTVIIVGALVWAVKSGQFDDLEGPAYKILMDDDEEPVAKSATHDAAGKPLTKADKSAESDDNSLN